MTLAFKKMRKENEQIAVDCALKYFISLFPTLANVSTGVFIDYDCYNQA